TNGGRRTRKQESELSFTGLFCGDLKTGRSPSVGLPLLSRKKTLRESDSQQPFSLTIRSDRFSSGFLRPKRRNKHQHKHRAPVRLAVKFPVCVRQYQDRAKSPCNAGRVPER